MKFVFKAVLVLIALIAVISIANKKENDFYDGVYQTSYFGIETIIAIRGDQIKHVSSFTAEAIVDCEQFKDRIEYEDADGITRILRVKNDSTLVQKIGIQDMIFYKIKDE